MAFLAYYPVKICQYHLNPGSVGETLEAIGAMTLPNIAEWNSLQLLYLIEQPRLIKSMMDMHRLSEGRDVNDPIPSPDEFAFLSTLSWGLLIREALTETKPVDLINMWGKHIGRLRGPGPPPRPLYRMAWLYHDIYKLKPMEVYRRLVLPELLKTGEVTIAADGKPNPEQDRDARATFLKAMTRFRASADKEK